MKKILSTLVLASFFTATGAHAYLSRDINLNEVDCYNSISKITCRADGYLSGHNSSNCEFTISYRSIFNDRGNVIKSVESFAYHVTNTGVLAWTTLGLSDAIVNQRNAIAARAEAKKEIKRRISDIKTHINKCN